jgi:hypothetical protein
MKPITLATLALVLGTSVASVPIPKFANTLGTPSCELRNQGDTGNPKLLAPLFNPKLAFELAALLCELRVGGAIAQSTFTPSEETPEQFPAGAGRDETFYACTACHNFKLVAAQGMTRRQWEESLAWMTQRHNMPPLEGKERNLVLDYLEATFPPRAPASPGGWRNPFSKQ